MREGAGQPQTMSGRGCVRLAMVVCLLSAGPSHAQVAAPVPIFHLFLKDGSSVVSYGEYTRDGDRVVLPVPVGPIEAPDGIKVVSVPSMLVDWSRTQQHTDVVRYRHYAATRGERDYVALTDQVATALARIAETSDPAVRLTIARETRAVVAGWTRSRYGYRSADARGLVELLDEAVLVAQVALGDRSFSFDLVASTEPPDGPQMPVPTLIGVISSAQTVARLADVPEERLSLQQAIQEALGRRSAELPAPWVSAVRADIAARRRTDDRTARAYASLRADALRDVARAAARGNVAGVERAIADARAGDIRLGRRRRNEMDALTAALETYLEAARQRRLEIDRWAYRMSAYRQYRDSLRSITKRLEEAGDDLRAIRAQSGPDPRRLARQAGVFAELLQRLGGLTPPADLRTHHDTLVSAVRLHGEAVRLRDEAVRRANPALAADASAAAAGARLLFGSAREGLARYFQRPDRR